MQKSLMVTCIINAMEGRDVVFADISSVFLHTDMVHGDRTVRVSIGGVLADSLVNIYPEKFTDKVVLEGE